MADDPLYQAFEHFQAGRLDPAADLCRAILSRQPDNAGTHHLLGVIYFQQGSMAAARDHMTKACASLGATPEMHNNFGAILNTIGDTDAAISAFKRAIAEKSDYADAFNNLGVAYRDAKRVDDAIDAFRRAVALNPDFQQAKSNLRATYRDVVPAWHFAMMDDTRRNDAYEAAIARAVPGKRVLDIGTGAGLLAMMSARSGAASVTSCEMVRLIADRARDIVALNGFGDRVTVVGKRSNDLAVGADLVERAEVLVTETFSSTLISEGVLASVEHAVQHLLVPGAVVIPAAASAMGCLVGGSVLEGMLFTDRIKGFNLTPFNDFAPPYMPVNLDALPFETLSGDTELLRFDLGGGSFPMSGHPVTLTATKTGTCVGVAQWILLELDAQNRYDNRPNPGGDFNGHWAQVLYRFPRLIPVKPGDTVRVLVRHDRKQLNVDLGE